MTRLNSKQLRAIADWCREREIFPDRVTGSNVAAACKSLGIAHDGDFDLYDVMEVGSLCEAE